LTNALSATLRFWHDYDFTERSDNDILEYGYVYIMTNSVSDPIALTTYSGDASGGWIEESLDLSAYMGNTVYIIWEYQLLSMESATRPGWLVDDVSIVISNATTGAITVTNNLSQAQWTLSGAQSTNGAGLSTTLSNLAAGTYIIQWTAVTDYDAPSAQTNTLAAGGALTFTGLYTMPDVNGNGISDLWEKRYFGSVSASHSAAVDSDHDGMSDYAEFIAGTNPTNAASVFAVDAVTSGSAIQLEWTLAANRSYRVAGSTNIVDWTPVSAWLYNTNRYTITPSRSGPPTFYRIEVKP
jgi:hypothetical protein